MGKPSIRTALALLTGALLCIPDDARAERLWGPQGVLVGGGTGPQRQAGIARASDGSFGVAWQNLQLPNYQIRAQRIGANGALLWQSGGVLVSPSDSLGNRNPMIRPDAGGGFAVVWERGAVKSPPGGSSTFAFEVFGQRIDSSGNRLWIDGGVDIPRNGEDETTRGGLIPDGGGEYLAWWREQSLVGSGQVRSVAAGLSVSGEPGFPPVAVLGDDVRFVPHPGIGVTIVWSESVGLDRDVFAERIDLTGSILWDLDLVDAPGNQRSVAAVADGAGGAVVVWEDLRTGSVNLYAQRIDPDGNPQWDANGRPITSLDADQTSPLLVASAEWFWTVWLDRRSGSPGIYAARFTASGSVLPGLNGSRVAAANPALVANPVLVEDGAGGAFVLWENTDPDTGIPGIRVQHIRGDFTVEFDPPLAVTASTSAQSLPAAVWDGEVGVVAIWEEEGLLTQDDVYAQRIVSGDPSPTPSPTRTETPTPGVETPTPGPTRSADLDGDGFVGPEDLLILIRAMRNTTP